MPIYQCSYAYDVPYYLNFTVEAESEEEADRKIKEAFENGVFSDLAGEPCYDNADSDRVFTEGEVTPHWGPWGPPLDELLELQDSHEHTLAS